MTSKEWRLMILKNAIDLLEYERQMLPFKIQALKEYYQAGGKGLLQ